MMNQKIINNERVVGNKKGRGTIIVSALLLLIIFTIATNDMAVKDVSAATSPSLGAATSFAVLAATAVTNVPTSAIIGDVGLSPAAGSYYTGLTAAQVTGKIYAVDATGPGGSVNDPTLLTNAQHDNTVAFGALSAAPNVACTAPDWTGTTKDLAGLTLVPGVYCADVFTLSGTLTLDAAGNANGVWIFRAAAASAALTTSPGVGAKVQFLNGIGSSCNVWWKVASSATIGSGTTFIGNILALTSISLGTGASLNGRALAQTGAVTLESNQINSACVVTVVTTVNGTITTITVTGIVSLINGQIVVAVIPEYPWGVLLLLVLMLPVYMLLKRGSQNSSSKRRSQ
jgi:hypothetical protein